MAKILRDTNSRRRRARDDHLVNGDHLQGMMEWIENDTERYYSQTEYGMNALVVVDRGDGENPWRCQFKATTLGKGRLDWIEKDTE
jgi:hypothetical protein